MAAGTKRDKLDRLDELPEGSTERLACAVSLVESERGFEVLYAALLTIEADAPDAVAADPDLKPMLLDRYRYLGDNGPRRDPGCLLRSSILRILREALTGEDAPLLEAAVGHYELVRESESAAGLRASALVALDDVDGESASLHAVRLLGETRRALPPDEAAATSVRVLAARELLHPLYLYALLPGGSPVLVSECLRHLTLLPAALLPSLVESVSAEGDSAAMVGLMDLLISHDSWRDHQSTVLDFLGSTDDLEAHYYVLTSIMTGRRPELVEEVVAMARFETEDARLRNYVAALSLREHDDEIREALDSLEARL